MNRGFLNLVPVVGTIFSHSELDGSFILQTFEISDVGFRDKALKASSATSTPLQKV